MQLLSPEVRNLIAPDTSAIYDMYAERSKREERLLGLDIVRASAIAIALLEQTGDLPWPEHLDAELSIRQVHSRYSTMSASEKRTISIASLGMIGVHTKKARTIPQEVTALRLAVEAAIPQNSSLLTT